MVGVRPITREGKQEARKGHRPALFATNEGWSRVTRVENRGNREARSESEQKTDTFGRGYASGVDGPPIYDGYGLPDGTWEEKSVPLRRRS